MNPQEGVIKFELDYTEADPLPDVVVGPARAWREVLYRLRFIGQSPARYGGLAYGNLSWRLDATEETSMHARRFAITGSQTGGLESLTARHFTVVEAFDVATNRLSARGPLRPSSEALTHAALYAADPRIRCVMHVHAPEIWYDARRLGLAVTSPRAAYGTPAMAAEMAKLVTGAAQRRRPVLVMGGHEDGVVSFGADFAEAGLALVDALALALGAG